MKSAARHRQIRYLALAFGGLVAAVLFVATIVWVKIDQIQQAARDVAEAHGELAWADAAADAANDQQIALDGVLATHDQRYVRPFKLGQQRFEHAFEQLTAFALNDSAEQRRDVAEAGRLARAWMLTVAGPQVAAVEAGRLLPPPSRAASGGLTLVERRIDDLRTSQVGLLAQRERVLTGAYGAARMAMALGSAAALSFVLVILGLAAGQLLNDRRRAEDAARRLGAALEGATAADRTKTRFLANMSHEMRTPLNGVIGMTEVLAQSELDAKQRELVDAIRFSSSTLNHLIGDLIAVSRDGLAAPIGSKVETFDLGAAIRAMALPFALEAEAKGLTFAVTIDPAADTPVIGDSGSLGELLACLLSNALKFTELGQVRVDVRRVDEATVGVRVFDTGIGFDDAAKVKMFETFTQEDDSDTRRFGGAGLGLAVARRLAIELGGTLDAHSTPGEGSVFDFDMALTVASAGTESDESPDAISANQADPSLHVLIVDDNATNRKVLELILESLGVSWLSVENGLQAVDAVRAQTFSAILMDIQMPVMDGLTATREIRRIEREAGQPAVPVIIVSASCQPEHMDAGRAAGAQQHLAKPVGVRALIEALNEVLIDATRAA